MPLNVIHIRGFPKKLATLPTKAYTVKSKINSAKKKKPPVSDRTQDLLKITLMSS